ncbi:MipA/OmpV family protein [Gilvimarinus sp. SDUM040013]|uniref:MipA/OmpV family protein n=1 Tax=Gilvimarinus gilvus TaxID=3058038 RepID=A0ABU4RXA5_9GAMM|nr:MipA/OmpV family protein [Gilvimarinus sp. SDUM040013]MDO3388640.1 MipA/OmpV family protein [Gilvimarinus sp. SDUM040013]MDX6849535.1 MipA/OmpV family protein [Gilvimarinus sp. SDUM040013]
MIFLRLLTVCLVGLVGSAALAQVPGEKRWEAGIGLGGLSAPDYKGSKSYRQYIAPIPYVVYRGPVIRTDRDGVRGDFWRTDRLELNASMALSVTPDTDKNELRQGMPELLSTLEVGPALNINLTGQHFSEGLALTVPIRAVFTVGDGAPEYIGFTSAPSLVYRLAHGDGWKWSMRAGPVFASGRYHDYYYSVKPAYANSERPEYEAGSGYNGFNGQLALSRRFSDYWYAFYVRYSNIQGAGFLDSPLIETEHNVTAGFAVSWVFL